MVTVAGAAAAARSRFVGYLLALRGTFFGGQNSGGTRAALAAGGAVAAGVVFAAACLVAT